MKFSIIIPIYKVEVYLHQCVDSVLAQSYKNIEVILVDDGSPDSCPRICDEYAAKDERIKVIHKPNGGLSDARNSGLKIANGDYVIFLDSDDYYNNTQFLQDIHDQLFFKNADVLFFRRIYFIDGNNNSFNRQTPYDKSMITISNKGKLIKKMSAAGVLDASAAMKVIKREILITNNLYFKSGIVSEDVEWFMRLVPSLCTILVSNSIAYCYRVRLNSISHSISYKNINDLFSTIESYAGELCMLSDRETGIGLLNYLAYQYSIVLGYTSKYLIGVEKQNMLDRCANYKWIMKYALNKKTKVCKLLIFIFGLKFTSYTLGKYLASINR